MPEDNKQTGLGKLTNVVSKLGRRIVVPDDSTGRELEATSKMYDEAGKALNPTSEELIPVRKSYGTEALPKPINLRARYGDRPGEKRINTDEMTRPLGSIPVYDQGGDVKPAPQQRSTPDFNPRATHGRPQSGDFDSPSKPAPQQRSTPDFNPRGSIPVYDKGGDVSTNNFESISSIPLGKGAPVKPVEQYADASKGRVNYGAFKGPKNTFDGGSVDGVKDTALSSPHYMPGGGPTEPAPAMSSVMPQSSAMPRLKVYDDGGDVNVDDGKHQAAFLEEGEKVLTPSEAAKYDAEHPESVHPPLMSATSPAPQDAGPSPHDLITHDKEEAAKKGDLVGMGKAILADRHVVSPSKLGRIGSVEPVTSDVNGALPNPDLGASRNAAVTAVPSEMHQDVAGGPLISGAPTNYDKSTSRDFASMERKAKLADYDQRIQKALDAGTPEGETEADRLRMAKMNYQQSTPWGSEGNHPGILGKIGHVASQVGNIAGDIVAPRIMQLVPGTDLNRKLRLSALGNAISTDTENQLRSQKEPVNKEWQEISGGAIDPKHPELGAQPAFYNKNNPDEGIKFGNVPLAPKPGEAKNEPASSALVNDHLAKIKSLGLTGQAADVYGNPPAGATAAELEKRYADAAQLKGMNQKDAENQINNQLRKDAETEHKQEFNERQDAKLVNYRDKNGDLVSGTRAEALANGAKASDIHGETSPALQEKSRQAYTQYSRILDNAQEALNTLPAWDDATPQGKINRKAAMDVAKQYWEHLSGNAYVVGVGINPEYTQQFINSDAYKKMDDAGRTHMQNMFQLWSDAINIVKQETGGVPRGQVFLQREDAILPHPDKTPQMNEKALLNLAKRVHKDAQEYARPSDVDPLQRGIIPPSASHQLRDKKTNQIVGYTDAQGKDHLF